MTDLYYFTYYYGNGDNYSGYGYADPDPLTGTPYAGQLIGYSDGITDATLLDGFYYITGVSSGYTELAGLVVVNSYYDVESNSFATSLTSETGYGSAGLGSELYYASNFGGATTAPSMFGGNLPPYVSSEADLIPAANIGTYLYSFTYYYGNGDAYSGYGIADPAIGTQYSVGQVIADGIPDITGADGYYYISAVSDAVSSGYFDPAGSVVVNSYYDVETNSLTTLIASVSGSIYTGSGYLGSELGYASNFGGSITAPSMFGGNLFPYVSSEADLIVAA